MFILLAVYFLWSFILFYFFEFLWEGVEGRRKRCMLYVYVYGGLYCLYKSARGHSGSITNHLHAVL